ncbi:hypothetical protein [Paraburkholderia fungorum]|uniref:Uncharacterized protein n=1 Tax=Paraburkholderia fungorum TaxID=134537 RepID=A0AAW3V0M2_9BURK|nr:hypothetical protein [Paraburkholderia fungorum]MBB4517429.1 hypothetical protein [Paraburkholderia fungorum]MBB6204497.1 hypothetical protein [Paraburkholderia fungorum]
MPSLIDVAHASHVISETESRRVYRFNGAVLTDVKIDGKWVTISVL